MTNQNDLFRQQGMLTEMFYQLGGRLFEAGRAMQESGMPAGEDFISELNASRRSFADFRSAVVGLAEGLQVPFSTGPDEFLSLKQLEPLVLAVANEQERLGDNEARERALVVLERVLAMTHRTEFDFEPLRHCHDRARELQRAISDAGSIETLTVARALAEGEHAIAQLLTLVERREELDDSYWDDLRDAVTDAFGKPLSLAAARGKLQVDPSARDFDVVSTGQGSARAETQVVEAPIAKLEEPPPLDASAAAVAVETKKPAPVKTAGLTVSGESAPGLGAKFIAIYPRPKDVEVFEKVYKEEHVPLSVEKLIGKSKYVLTKILGAPHVPAPAGTRAGKAEYTLAKLSEEAGAPYYRIVEIHFPTVDVMKACIASRGAKDVVSHAVAISTGGPPIFCICEEETFEV